MSGHTRGDLSPATYFERFIACLLRKSENGELRVSGADFDKLTNEATTLTFYWDPQKQEIVARGAKNEEMVIDTFRVNPETAATPKQQPRVTDPLEKTLFRRNAPSDSPFVMTPSNLNPMDDEAVKRAEDARVTARAKVLVREMLKARSNG
jgi:hypothetical protein